MQLYGNIEGLGTVSANNALNWNCWDCFGSELCVHVGCMILHCFA